MGELNVQAIASSDQLRQFYLSTLRDIEALDYMLHTDAFESKSIKIGAEQELCIVDKRFDPAPIGTEMLNSINDPAYTYELGKFNLEFNLDPFDLSGTAFRKTERQLIELLNKGEQAADEFGATLFLAGILPSLRKIHLDFEYMVPLNRFKNISNTLLNLRGGDFEIRVQGVDEFYSSLNSILYEACNTSFQLHLQIDPKEFVDKYNWSQMIAGPVLSLAVNSPLLFGKELWSETRIAIFKQSLDTRNFSNHLRTKEARVSFGSKWLSESFSEIYKDQLTRFPLLLATDIKEDPFDVLENGGIPKLKAVRLHNGTTYNWNRAIYGTGKKKANLRIECRYLSAGPTVADQMANFAFWIGLMNAMPENPESIWAKSDFRSTKDNFYRAARYGLNCNMDWMGQNLSARHLCLKILLPMARQGLMKVGIDPVDAERFLSIIERRADAGVTGSSWTVTNYRNLTSRQSMNNAIKTLMAEMKIRQLENRPVHEWKHIPIQHTLPSTVIGQKVLSLMSTDVLTVIEDAPISLAEKAMNWKKLNHIIIEDQQGSIKGVVSRTDIDIMKDEFLSLEPPIKAIMVEDIHKISAEDSLEKAKQLMKSHEIRCLPVFADDELAGIITMTDIVKWEESLSQSELSAN